MCIVRVCVTILYVFWYVSYIRRFPPVAGFVSQAHLVFGSRVVQTAEGTGRLTEVPWNHHQGAHCSAGGRTGQLGREGDRWVH